ncbi:hypothetical protein L6R52_12755, partial [Myxococcota bacterium]|nr:hypothetical protein [Myxococcota bacterium]
RCDRATATIGATGGVLELCGAKVTVPAGALSHDVELSIAQVDPGVAIPAPFVQVGPAWRIEPADLAGYAELELPHAEGWTDDLELVYLLEGAWSVHGACRQTERAVEMKVWDLGTFALVRDPRGMPTSPYGLGEGTATLTLDGRALTLTTGELGYAGVHETLSGFEVFGFQADLASEQVTAIVELAVQGERVIPSMIAVIDDLRSLFIAYDWVTGSGLVDVELDVVDGRWNVRLTGALLDDAHDEVPFTMTLEARPLAWSPLPSRICED